MAGTVEDIKAKADIVSIIAERITLKKAGKHFKALCPFHGEKSPSFMVSPELQIYKCFGCGESGDVITFLEKYEGMDFSEAIKFLSEKTGIVLESNFPPKKDKEKIYEINELVCKFYQYLLQKHVLGKEALSYLTEKRKLTMTSVSQFRLGYSPKDPKIFQKFFLEKKGINKNDLVSAGIAYESRNGLTDRFYDRIVFPLFDHRGNIVGFSGRIMPGRSKDLAKYINTPETPAYHKSEILFGLNFTKNDIKEKGFVIVTEGELDMISPWQRGIKNIVAIKGSAMTDAHLRLLSRFTNRITLALDADFAGNAAAKRGIEVATNQGLKVKVAVLEGYKDPDEMAVSDINRFKKTVDGAISVYDFIINSALRKYDPETIEGKIDISKEVIPFLTKIDDEIMKAYYVEVLAKKLKVPYESVFAEVEKKKVVAIIRKDENKEVSQEGNREAIESLLFTALLIKSPDEAVRERELFKSLIYKKMMNELVKYMRKGKFSPKSFSENLPEELRDKFNEDYLANSEELSDVLPDKIISEIEGLKKRLELLDLKSSQQKLIDKIREGEEKKDKDAVKKYQRSLNDLVKLKAKIVS